jgi:hypothetical protein
MSALGQKQTFRPFIAMSALPPKADIAGQPLDVRFVPKADMGLSAASKRMTPGLAKRLVVGTLSNRQWN